MELFKGCIALLLDKPFEFLRPGVQIKGTIYIRYVTRVNFSVHFKFGLCQP